MSRNSDRPESVVNRESGARRTSERRRGGLSGRRAARPGPLEARQTRPGTGFGSQATSGPRASNWPPRPPSRNCWYWGCLDALLWSSSLIEYRRGELINYAGRMTADNSARLPRGGTPDGRGAGRIRIAWLHPSRITSSLAVTTDQPIIRPPITVIRLAVLSVAFPAEYTSVESARLAWSGITGSSDHGVL